MGSRPTSGWHTAERDLSEQLERASGPGQVAPYPLKEESLRSIQENLRAVFLSSDRTISKRYLNFLLQRIEVEGNEVCLDARMANVLAVGVQKREEGTANQDGTVPPIVLDWLPGSERIRTPRPVIELAFCMAAAFGQIGRPRMRTTTYAFRPAGLFTPQQPAQRARETPIQRARRFQAMIDSGEARSRADLASQLECSRAWVTKVLEAGVTGLE